MLTDSNGLPTARLQGKKQPLRVRLIVVQLPTSNQLAQCADLLDQRLQQIEMQGVGPVGLRLFRRVVNLKKERIGAGRDAGASQRFDELGLTPTCTFLCSGKL